MLTNSTNASSAIFILLSFCLCLCSHFLSLNEIFFIHFSACNCDEIGTVPDTACDMYGGQCHCQPGVKGQRCDQCMAGHHSLTSAGCQSELIFYPVLYMCF